MSADKGYKGLGCVYALIDPESKEVRYIGSTTSSLRARLNGHGHRLDSNPFKYLWVRQLKDRSMRPIIHPIVECQDLQEMRHLEKRVISKYAHHHKLFNDGCIRFWCDGNEFQEMVESAIASLEAEKKIVDAKWAAMYKTAAMHTVEWNRVVDYSGSLQSKLNSLYVQRVRHRWRTYDT